MKSQKLATSYLATMKSTKVSRSLYYLTLDLTFIITLNVYIMSFILTFRKTYARLDYSFTI